MFVDTFQSFASDLTLLSLLPDFFRRTWTTYSLSTHHVMTSSTSICDLHCTNSIRKFGLQTAHITRFRLKPIMTCTPTFWFHALTGHTELRLFLFVANWVMVPNRPNHIYVLQHTHRHTTRVCVVLYDSRTYVLFSIPIVPKLVLMNSVVWDWQSISPSNGYSKNESYDTVPLKAIPAAGGHGSSGSSLRCSSAGMHCERAWRAPSQKMLQKWVLQLGTFEGEGR